MKVGIIGTGYVGLTTGVCLAYLGHEVSCFDIDENKINLLQDLKSPVYEPWLEDLMSLARANLTFTRDIQEAVSDKKVIFITVGTPSLPDGNPNLSYLCSAADSIGKNLGTGFTVIVNKSTVPIGSGNWVESLIRDAFESRNGHKPEGRFAILSNPEFLKEGSAIFDTLYPDRVVVGSDNQEALGIFNLLYKPVLEQTFSPPSFLPRPENLGAIPIITTNLASAELIKYSANSFLSLKISFINEIAQLSEKVGSDISQIAKGIGLDERIGTRFLQAGLGWGGSCFGKDTLALVSTAREYGLKMPIVEASRDVNYRQRERVIEKLQEELKILKGRTIALLGLAFKPNTDDLRDSPAMDIAERLINRGVKVKAHDPTAMKRAKKEAPHLPIIFCEEPLHVAEDADALLLVTEWPQYQQLPWNEMILKMRSPLLLDGRNFLDKEKLKTVGFRYVGVGR